MVQSSLADGDWHSLTVVISGNMASFYQDATLIDSRYMYIHVVCIYTLLTLLATIFSVSSHTGHWKSHLLEMKLEC